MALKVIHIRAFLRLYFSLAIQVGLFLKKRPPVAASLTV